MRKKFLNSPGQPVTKLTRTSFRSTFTLTPYSVRFCRQSPRTSERKYKKGNILRKSAQNSGPNSTANSLFQNILRVSPSGSRFCRERRRSISRNINRMNILQNSEEKKWGASGARQGGQGVKAPHTPPWATTTVAFIALN